MGSQFFLPQDSEFLKECTLDAFDTARAMVNNPVAIWQRSTTANDQPFLGLVGVETSEEGFPKEVELFYSEVPTDEIATSQGVLVNGDIRAIFHGQDIKATDTFIIDDELYRIHLLYKRKEAPVTICILRASR